MQVKIWHLVCMLSSVLLFFDRCPCLRQTVLMMIKGCNFQEFVVCSSHKKQDVNHEVGGVIHMCIGEAFSVFLYFELLSP